MKITEIRISNYRSINEEQLITPTELTTLIGPNNSGKTNVLKSICTFFGGYENSYGYDRSKDLPANVNAKQTSIILTFEIPDSEEWFWTAYEKLHQMHGTSHRTNCRGQTTRNDGKGNGWRCERRRRDSSLRSE